MTLSARWKQHIEDWQAGGLSQAECCRRHGLNANTFSGRLHHYRSQGLPPQPELIPIQVQPLPKAAEAASVLAGVEWQRLSASPPAQSKL